MRHELFHWAFGVALISIAVGAVAYAVLSALLP